MIGYLLRRQSDVADGDGWLTPAERRWYGGRRSAKRIADWRLGRWTAKAAITAWLERFGQPVPADLEVLAATNGAPNAFDAGKPLALALSLSHSHGRAVAAVAGAEVALGCDLELLELRSRAFVSSYFTAAERAAVAAADVDRDLVANLIWSGKESALKAVRRGLRVDARSLEVTVTEPNAAGWGGLQVTPANGNDTLTGSWRHLGGFVLTLVARPPAAQIVELG